MSFFDKFKKQVGLAAGKSKGALEIANLKSLIWMLRKQKDQLLYKLGELVYEQFKMKKGNPSKVMEQCKLIGETETELKNAEEKIKQVSQAVKELKVAAEPTDTVIVCLCGMELSTEDKFCRKCGRSSDEILSSKKETPSADKLEFCIQCGTPKKKNSSFCPRCGCSY